MDSLYVLVSNLEKKIDSLLIMSNQTTGDIWELIRNLLPLVIAFFAVLYGPRLLRKSSKEQLENIKIIENNKFELEKEKLKFGVEKVKAELNLKIEMKWLEDFFELTSEINALLFVIEHFPKVQFDISEVKKFEQFKFKFTILLDLANYSHKKLYNSFTSMIKTLQKGERISQSQESLDFTSICQVIIKSKQEKLRNFSIVEKKLSEKLEELELSLSKPNPEELLEIAKKFNSDFELRKQVLKKIKENEQAQEEEKEVK